MGNRRFVFFGGATLVMLIALWAPRLVAQGPSGTRSIDQTSVDPQSAIRAAMEAAKKEAASNFTASKTPWGDPDLSGYYVVATYTTLERPLALKDKEFYTEEEAAAAFRKAVEDDAAVDPKNVHYDWKEYGMDAWQNGVRPNLRTSLIVDPRDGRIPPLTPDAQKRRADRLAAANARNPEVGVQTLPQFYTRCIMGNAGGGPLVRGGNPAGANALGSAGGVTAEFQLVQAPGYVVIITESNSDAHIIPLDRRPPLASTVRSWLGDSRGHWDGGTLVVETANYNDKSPGTNYQGSTSSLRLVERFTLVGPKSMRYQYTVSDPQTWTSPWSVDSTIPRIDPPLYEFACHEQNYGLINVVRGAQIREAEAAGKGAARPYGTGGGDR